MEYINSGDENSSVQDVSEDPYRKTKVKQCNYNNKVSRYPNKVKGLTTISDMRLSLYNHHECADSTITCQKH